MPGQDHVSTSWTPLARNRSTRSTLRGATAHLERAPHDLYLVVLADRH